LRLIERLYCCGPEIEERRIKEEKKKEGYNLVLALLAGCYVNNRGYLVEHR